MILEEYGQNEKTRGNNRERGRKWICDIVKWVANSK